MREAPAQVTARDRSRCTQSFAARDNSATLQRESPSVLARQTGGGLLEDARNADLDVVEIDAPDPEMRHHSGVNNDTNENWARTPVRLLRRRSPRGPWRGLVREGILMCNR